MCNKSNFNETMRAYAEYIALMNQAKEEAEKLKQEIIRYMQECQIDTLHGIEHKATYKKVVAMRFDTKAFKLDNPAAYDKYAKETTTNRFNFN